MPAKTRKAAQAARDPSIPILPAVLSMAEILSLSPSARLVRFADRSTVSQRAFAEMGKLHYAISAGLTAGQTVYGELRKGGVKDSTISNASYASKVWDLVQSGHLSEPQFDTFSFADCLAVVRVISPKSKRQLGPEEVAALVTAMPASFDVELQSIYETGLTVEESEAQAKAAAEKKAEEAAAVEAAKAAKAASDQSQKVISDQAPTAASTPAKPAATTPAAETDAAETAEVAGEEAPPAETEAPAPAQAPSPTTPAPAPVTPTPAPATAPAPEAVPSNVHQMPADDDGLTAILSALDEITLAASELSVEGQKAVFAKLNQCMELLSESINPAAAVAA